MNNKDFKWTEKRFGLTFANILKKLGGLSKNDTDGSLEYKDEQGNVSKLVTDSTFSSLLAKNGLIEVKWQELKDKRDNGQLIPGSLYRITDYNCTTTQQDTRSAGHQFDIVLLALGEDKLAEEGWAMMHDNIYDVTFADGVTKKCYIYSPYSGSANVVILDTLLGAEGLGIDGDIFINEDDKTATVEYPITDLDEENVPYNYFQNSNLSAWKVWYCLDNDKSRFAWADDRDDETIKNNIECVDRLGTRSTFYYTGTVEIGSSTYHLWELPTGGGQMYGALTTSATPNVGDTTYRREGNGVVNLSIILSFTEGHEGKYIPATINVDYELKGQIEHVTYTRYKSSDRVFDNEQYYGWRDEENNVEFTKSETPNVEDSTYYLSGKKMVIDDEASLVGFTPGVDAEKGRGVIYRLIDEWNNDVAYDFKNIQYVRKLTDGILDTSSGTDTWVYTFNGYDLATEEILDASIHTGELLYEDDTL